MPGGGGRSAGKKLGRSGKDRGRQLQRHHARWLHYGGRDCPVAQENRLAVSTPPVALVSRLEQLGV
eukprot:CAMPEP_0172621034 /NCGR_PEP_ID=MMETSP1068-20121228/108260_1 /TAXON_ID=35684 /ORGANISM="Pseudopedinella elastica, Strain CCMP716" /LENGTH=65 /DNA_ID=CAMNT_0013428565 /DNA_START=187 /DNA_END=384 /DNA_ORIENTATION=-